jgi:hypothetical protein
MKETKRIIEERVKEQEEGTLVIGGDFNARIGGKGRRMEEQQATIERRPTKRWNRKRRRERTGWLSRRKRMGRT